MIFKTPYFLVLIPILVVGIVWFKKREKKVSVRFSSLELVKDLKQTWRNRISRIPFYLRLLAVIFLVIALAGPRKLLIETQHKTQGIDVVLAIDASGSMAAEDFTWGNKRVNRLRIVKTVVADFIDGRKDDRIGLVVFSALAYTACPLTVDYHWLKANLERVELGMIKDGTAIGSAISAALIRLNKSVAKSKVVVLLTDGVNNTGKISPQQAAEAANALGVKIYTIGAGTKGLVPFPVKDRFGRTFYQNVQINLDEETLQAIADKTGGKYFRATDSQSLIEIYKAIDALEKSDIEHKGFQEYEELFGLFVVLSLLCLWIEILIERLLISQIP